MISQRSGCTAVGRVPAGSSHLLGGLWALEPHKDLLCWLLRHLAPLSLSFLLRVTGAGEPFLVGVPRTVPGCYPVGVCPGSAPVT